MERVINLVTWSQAIASSVKFSNSVYRIGTGGGGGSVSVIWALKTLFFSSSVGKKTF